MTPKYMMATTAIHNLGDISREQPDICHVYDEDADNYIGRWLTGYGFIDVKFPKVSTRDLTSDEVEKYHGKPIGMGDGIYFLDIKNEKFAKDVKLFKDGKEIFGGILISPVKVGSVLYVVDLSTGKYYHTSTIQEVQDKVVKTKNSTYTISYES